MEKKQVYLVTASMAILHDGKRYEKGDQIELAETEAENLSLYVQLVPTGNTAKTAETTDENTTETPTDTADEPEQQAVNNEPKSAKSGKATKAAKAE